jgi:hypothetical protein
MWVPAKAVNPGLVYDIAATDYVDFLCAINYGPMQIAALTKKRASDVCVTNRTYAVGGLNYPSFSVKLSTDRGTVKHTRTLTNVGPPRTYKVATASAATGSTLITVSVEPKTLSFSKTGEKQSYTVRLHGRRDAFGNQRVRPATTTSSPARLSRHGPDPPS